MIWVDRRAVEIPPVLITEDDGKTRGGKSSGLREARLARESLAKWKREEKDPRKWSFGFKIYKHKDVTNALIKLFHGKCAYCETRYAATQPMDVEHWRPKGQVELEDGTQKKPAYYWLAAEWENLLPSCIDCNRKRKQIDAVNGTEVSLGKKDRFPVDQESNRAQKEGDEINEAPLLLNPCKDDPIKFLKFEKESVIAARATDEFTKKRAEASIEVYGLNRSGLVLNRKEYHRLIDLRIATIKGLARLMIDYSDLPESVEIIIEELMLGEMKELVKAQNPEQPYAMLARQLINESMAEFGEFGLTGYFSDSPG